MKILFATNNPAKIRYYGNKLKEKGIEIITPAQLPFSIDIEENGETPVENALIKAKAYHQVTAMITLAMDEGLYFDTLDQSLQPGTHVRRIQGKRLTDQEMVDYYTSLIKKYGIDGHLDGYFLKGTAIVAAEKTLTHECRIKRQFSQQASTIIDPGYPLASLQIIPGVEKFKSELTAEEEKITMDIEQQEIFEFLFKSFDELNQ